jgi:hypothetical protein
MASWRPNPGASTKNTHIVCKEMEDRMPREYDGLSTKISVRQPAKGDVDARDSRSTRLHAAARANPPIRNIFSITTTTTCANKYAPIFGGSVESIGYHERCTTHICVGGLSHRAWSRASNGVTEIVPLPSPITVTHNIHRLLQSRDLETIYLVVFQGAHVAEELHRQERN